VSDPRDGDLRAAALSWLRRDLRNAMSNHLWFLKRPGNGTASDLSKHDEDTHTGRFARIDRPDCVKKWMKRYRC